MRKAFWRLPVLVMLLHTYGCSLFREVRVRQEDSLYSVSEKTSLDWTVDSVHSVSRILSYTDSSGASFDVEIVPSGAFTFSPQAGFTGSASVVRMRGVSQRSVQARDSTKQHQESREKGSLEQKEKVRTETAQKQSRKARSTGLWWPITLAVTCFLGFLLYKRLRGGGLVLIT